MTSEELKAKIKEEVDKAWADDLPVLLSNLGALDGGEVAKAAKHEAGGLANFIQQHMENEVELIKHSKIPAAIGVVPVNRASAEEDDADKLLEAKLSAYKRKDSKTQFNRRFWTAFRKPLDEGQKRYIQIESPFGFENFDEGGTPSDNFIELPRDYIASDDSTSDDDVYKNIERWVAENSLTLDDFSFRRRMASTHKGQRGLSILDSLLDALDTHDLKRLEMPLDIVWKLRNSKK